jgi:hypothetical protein
MYVSLVFEAVIIFPWDNIVMQNLKNLLSPWVLRSHAVSWFFASNPLFDTIVYMATSQNILNYDLTTMQSIIIN